MKLYIDTSNAETISVSLLEGEKKVKTLSDKNKFGSQALLPLIKKLLKEEKVKLESLREVMVHTGPGSFTGLKVGVSVANSLGFSLGILVNGKKIETNINY